MSARPIATPHRDTAHPAPWPRTVLAGWSPSPASPSAASPPSCSSDRSTTSAPPLAGGLVTGAVLGAVQAWALRADPAVPWPGCRPPRSAWQSGSAIGASLVHFRTGLGDLVVQGAVTGARRRLAQAAAAAAAGRPVALAWPVSLAERPGRSGWAVTTAGRGRRSTSSSPSSGPPAPCRHALTAVLPLFLAARPADREEPLMSRHVVFGTGQVGRPLVEQLVAHGHDVVAVNRNGRGDLPGAQVVGGDATDSAFTTEVCADADVVYFCLNAMSYDRWAEEFPPLQRGVLAGAATRRCPARRAGQPLRLRTAAGQRLVETMAANPTSTKAATRAAMTEELLAAHAAGRVEVAIGRASDYFGPGAERSALGETVFGTALTGRTAQVMGDPDQPHSYSYTPDVAAGPDHPRHRAGAAGQIWHLPVAEARTTRQIIDVYALAGHKPATLAAGRTTLRALGLVRTRDAGVPPHPLPVHRPLARRRPQVPGRLR